MVLMLVASNSLFHIKFTIIFMLLYNQSQFLCIAKNTTPHVFSLMFLFTSSNCLVTDLDTLRIQDTPIDNNVSNYFIRNFIICVLIEFSFIKKLNIWIPFIINKWISIWRIMKSLYH